MLVTGPALDSVLQTSAKPIIAVVANSGDHVREHAHVIERSGGEPWAVLPEHRMSSEETVARVGGLVVCAGYRETSVTSQEHRQDNHPLTLPLLETALKTNMPVLCVSMGMQALNVVMGGKPGQAIPGHGILKKEDEMASSYHRIYISPGSKLAAVVGSGGFVRVNSRHHQGVTEIQKSPLLLASAYSLHDGVIESLESPHHRWVIGVQFHPERRKEIPPHFDRLFQSMVDRAKEYLSTAKS